MDGIYWFPDRDTTKFNLVLFIIIIIILFYFFAVYCFQTVLFQ